MRRVCEVEGFRSKLHLYTLRKSEGSEQPEAEIRRSGPKPQDLTHATRIAANVGAAISAAAPRNRGFSTDEATWTRVAASASVSARSARASRTVTSMRSQAVVISPAR